MPNLLSTASLSRRASVAIAFLLGSIVFALQAVFWYLHIRRDFFPSGDEFSILAHSVQVFHPSPAGWFLSGFSNYFNPYPDISLPYSNFIRPFDNATYFLNSLLFGTHWGTYLLVNYLAVASVTALTFYLALDLLGIALAPSLLLALSAAVSPASTTQLIYRPSFAFDCLAAVWVLLSVIFLIRRQLPLAWIFICLAVFTKEPAYFASPVACVVVYVVGSGRPRILRILTSCAFLLPVALMGVLRLVDFKSIEGIYVLNGSSLTSSIRNLLLGLTHWPYLIPGEQHIRDLSFHNGASLLFSLLLWFLVFSAGYRLFSSRNRDKNTSSPPAHHSLLGPGAIVYLFFVDSLIMPLFFDLTPRFGASSFPLLFLSLGYLMKPPTPFLLRWGASASLISMTCLSTAQLATVFSPGSLERERTGWILSRSLVDHLSHEAMPVVFLIDDVSEGFSSPRSLEKVSGYAGQIVPVSNMSLPACSTPPQIGVAERGKQEFVITSSIKPGCGSNVLYGASRLDLVSGLVLRRELATASLLYNAKDRPTSKGDFISQTLVIHLVSKVPRFTILIPDLRSGQYTSVTPLNAEP